MGRRHNVLEYRRQNSEVEEGYDSHVSPSKMEYVIFNPAQLLPLFVLHLGSASRKDMIPRQLDSFGGGYSVNGMPIEYSSLTKLSLTERARKYLPLGYGAATGTKFVVEAIAPVDDDEEFWGEFQGEYQREREKKFGSDWRASR
jgi:hypothetical protein